MMHLNRWTVLVLLIIGFFLYQGLKHTKDWMSSTWFAPYTAQSHSRGTLLTEIEELGTLVVIRTHFVESNLRINVTQGIFRFAASHSVTGTVEAGIDLRSVDSEDIAITSTHILLTLAPVSLTGCSISEISQYERSLSVMGVTDFDGMRELAQTLAIEQFRDDALVNGILNDAEIEVRQTLRGLLSEISGGLIIEIQFRDEDPVIPQSCDPGYGDGWVQAENGRFVQP